MKELFVEVVKSFRDIIFSLYYQIKEWIVIVKIKH